MRHSNISKVYFGAPRAYRYISYEQTRTRTRATRAHAHERKQSMYRIATQRRTQSMYRIATQERTQNMNNLQKKCDNCKYAYNSIHSTLVQCKMKERFIRNSKTGQVSIDFKHYSCYWWNERPATYKKINWERKEQQLTLF